MANPKLLIVQTRNPGTLFYFFLPHQVITWTYPESDHFLAELPHSHIYLSCSGYSEGEQKCSPCYYSFLSTLYPQQRKQWSSQDVATFKTKHSSTQNPVLYFSQSKSQNSPTPSMDGSFPFYSDTLSHPAPATLVFCSLHTKFVPITRPLHSLTVLNN